MKKSALENYACPATNSNLTLLDSRVEEDEVLEGTLISPNGTRFEIAHGVPDFTYPQTLPQSDADARKSYDESADSYDAFAYLTYLTYGEDEAAIAETMIDRLHLQGKERVLEIGCGTGRTSERILKRLHPEASLYLQELSPRCLMKAIEKTRDSSIPIEYSIANGCYLPLRDRCFDATFHFGGLNNFSDIGRGLRELSRVTKIGGRVVVADESMPPWLRETEFGKIMMNSNPLLKHPLPIQHIPICARNVVIEWILGGVFYLIHFTVGEGEPYANLDFEIPTRRGGTHRLRYLGQIECVDLETKRLAFEAQQSSGKSMHRWLSDVISEAARKEIEAVKKS